jgi:hypothetical protein
VLFYRRTILQSLIAHPARVEKLKFIIRATEFVEYLNRCDDELREMPDGDGWADEVKNRLFLIPRVIVGSLTNYLPSKSERSKIPSFSTPYSTHYLGHIGRVCGKYLKHLEFVLKGWETSLPAGRRYLTALQSWEFKSMLSFFHESF